MPFDETLAERLRPLLRGSYSVNERKMFGGLAFMVNGHMSCGIVGKDLVVRTNPMDSRRLFASLTHVRWTSRGAL